MEISNVKTMENKTAVNSATEKQLKTRLKPQSSQN